METNAISGRSRHGPGAKLAVIRQGHMGDVLITEPIISVLRDKYSHVTIYTDFPRVAALLPVIDEIVPYPGHLCISEGQFDRVINPLYEIYAGINHLNGFAKSVGVELRHRVPVLRRGSPRIVDTAYGFVAPHTSNFVKSMREWPESRFVELAQRLEDYTGLPFVLLRRDHSFDEMVSLIEHCELFVGNDSGPSILAQCFNRPSFVIFGATRSDLVLLAEDAVGITKGIECNGCKHFARHTDIMCATPMCLTTLDVKDVFSQIVVRLKTHARTDITAIHNGNTQ